jgi:hypothetical protein
MHALADSGAFWVVLIVLAAALYMLPTLIGLFRGVDGLALVFLVNLIGGTALIGWPAAMVLAFGPRRMPRPRAPGSPFIVPDPERFWVPRPPNSPPVHDGSSYSLG